MQILILKLTNILLNVCSHDLLSDAALEMVLTKKHDIFTHEAHTQPTL